MNVTNQINFKLNVCCKLRSAAASALKKKKADAAKQKPEQEPDLQL